MKKILLFILFVSLFALLEAQILVTPAEVSAINTAQSAAEGDIYKDTENNVFYIGTSSGLLKILGDVTKVDASLSGDGSVANPLGIAPMGALSGQILSWNGTSWVPVNAAPATTTVTNSIALGQLTTTVNGVSATAVTLPTADGSETKINNGTNTTVAGAGTTASPYTVSVADATTTAKGVVQLAGDLAGTATSPQIAANAVTTAEIANATILNEDIANNTIASGKILDGTIATIDLGDAQVTYAKIQNVAGQRLLGNPTGTAASPSEISLGTGLTFSGTSIAATNTTALWNANKLQGDSISITDPMNGQVLVWNGSAWVPSNAAPATTTVGNTVTAPNSLTTTVNGTTGASVSMVTGVSNTSSANNLSTTVNGVTGTNVNIVNSISNSIASGQLTTTVNGVSATAVTLPTADGSETKLNNGTNTTVAGAGTTASPYTVSVADATTSAKGVVQLAGDLAGTATSPQIAASAVTTAEILDLTIGTGDVAVGAITSDKIQDATIATIDIGNSQVTYAKIQSVTAQRLLGNPTGATATASEISLGTGLTFSGTTIAATNTTALWNANLLQGNAVSSTTPTSGQVLSWNGTSWAPTSSPGWSITGNATTNPLTNFIGTTDNQRLVFRTNNVERATFLTNGNFGVGIASPDATVHNNGSSINTVRAIANKPTGGNIETAANSVDIGSTFSINQTTAGQTLTIPSPTVTTAGRLVKVSNIGSVSFKMANIVLAPSKYADFLWTGSAWIPAVAEVAPTLTNKNYTLSAEFAGAVLVPGTAPLPDIHKGNMNGGNTGAVAPLYMNYYEWQGRSGSGAQTYQVIVRITLPNDFTEWQTNAMQLSNMANLGCSVKYDIYNVSSGAAIYSGSSLTNPTWTVTTLSPANLSSWVTPGQTVAMIITFSSTLSNFSRVGDIVLNYK